MTTKVRRRRAAPVRRHAKPGGHDLVARLQRRLGELPPDSVRGGNQVVIVIGSDDVIIRPILGGADPARAAGRLSSSIGAIEAALDMERESEVASAAARDSKPLSPGELAVLQAGGFDLRPGKPGERDPILEGATHFARMVNGSLTVQEAAARLGGVNESRVRQRLLADPPTLYALKTGREWRLPKFQFQRRGTVPGLEIVVAALPRDLDPVSVESWFMIPNPDLAVGEEERAVSPIEWLKLGGAPERAAELAKDL